MMWGEVLGYRVRLAFHQRDATKVQSEMALTLPIEHDERMASVVYHLQEWQ